MSPYERSLVAARFAALAPEPVAGNWDDVLRRAAEPRPEGWDDVLHPAGAEHPSAAGRSRAGRSRAGGSSPSLP